MGRPNIFRVVDGGLYQEDQGLEEQRLHDRRDRNTVHKIMDQYNKRMTYLERPKYVKMVKEKISGEVKK